MWAKLDSNEARLARAGSNERGAVSVPNEIQLLLMADLDFPVRDRNKRILVRDDELGAPIRCSDAGVICRKTSRAFKDPKGLDIGSQLMPGLDERKFHFVPFASFTTATTSHNAIA